MCVCVYTHTHLGWAVVESLIPELGRQRQEASLVYKMSSRTTRTVTQRNPVWRVGGQSMLLGAYNPYIWVVEAGVSKV